MNNKISRKFDIIPRIWKVVRNFGFWCIINHIQSQNVWITANVARLLSWFLNKVYDYERKNRETDRLIAGKVTQNPFSMVVGRTLILRRKSIKPVTSGRAVISKQTAPVISDTPRVLGSEIAITVLGRQNGRRNRHVRRKINIVTVTIVTVFES